MKFWVFVSWLNGQINNQSLKLERYCNSLEGQTESLAGFNKTIMSLFAFIILCFYGCDQHVQ